MYVRKKENILVNRPFYYLFKGLIMGTKYSPENKLESLTPEMEALIPVVRDEWINRAYNNTVEMDEDAVKQGIIWLYEKSGLPAPMVIIVDSPSAAQDKANELYREHIDPNAERQYFAFSDSMSVSDYRWVAFYDYFTRIGVLDDENFNTYMGFTKLGVYDTIKLHDVCIVVRMPEQVKSTIVRGVRVPHSEDTPAVKFRDGDAYYFWNGTVVPEKWIMDKDGISQSDIMAENNAEMRRCLMEILGAKKYYDVISNGEGLTLLDEDTDNQGFPMRLYETTNNDSVIDKKVQFLEVTDPSTGRVYNIYPPNQNATNVWDAKAQTFNFEKLYVRQGDVGLTKVGYDEVAPVQET